MSAQDSFGSGEPWYASARTGFVDPVLDRRLAEFFAERDPVPAPSALRGAVFDLVTGSKNAAEVARELNDDPDDRRRLVERLDARPDLEEIRAALVRVNRHEEAAALGPDTPLVAGEFEARLRAPRLSARAAVLPPSPASEPRPAERPSASPHPGPASGTPGDRRPSSEAAPTPREPPEPSALHLRDLRASIERLEAKVDHVLSLLRVAGLAAVGLVLLAALAAIID